MALDYHQATPQAEVRFEGDFNKAKSTGPQKAPEVASAQRAPTQARAEVRVTQQQMASTKEKVIAISSQTDTGIDPQAKATQGFTTKSNSRRPAHSVETKAAHPKDYVRNKANNNAIDPSDTDEKVENLDEVLGAIVISPAIARRKAREALAAMEKQNLALEKNVKAEAVKRPPTINPEKLLASIQGINTLVADIKTDAMKASSLAPTSYAQAETIELEDKELQAAADAYEKEELAGLVKKYPDSMRKKRAKIVAQSKKEGNAQASPEELIASIRAIRALVEAKEAKTANQSIKKTVTDEELTKPADVLARMNDMNNYLERAFSAMLNNQPDVANSTRASLARNFQFQPLE